MKYLVTLKPLEPFLFDSDNTFGKLGDEAEETYLAKNRYFPQHSAILGILKRELMTQELQLIRKARGERVEKNQKRFITNF